MTRAGKTILAAGFVSLAAIGLVALLSTSGKTQSEQDRWIDIERLCSARLDQACDLLGISRLTPKRNLFCSLAQAVSSPGAPGLDNHWVEFNPVALESVLTHDCSNDVCDDVVVLWLMGHGAFHIAAGDPLNSVLKEHWFLAHSAELFADFAAGWVLGRARFTSDDAERVVRRLSPHWTKTHPAGSDRAPTIMMGCVAGLEGESLWGSLQRFAATMQPPAGLVA